jgi:hypothetical protein
MNLLLHHFSGCKLRASESWSRLYFPYEAPRRIDAGKKMFLAKTQVFPVRKATSKQKYLCPICVFYEQPKSLPLEAESMFFACLR